MSESTPTLEQLDGPGGVAPGKFSPLLLLLWVILWLLFVLVLGGTLLIVGFLVDVGLQLQTLLAIVGMSGALWLYLKGLRGARAAKQRGARSGRVLLFLLGMPLLALLVWIGGVLYVFSL
jgi:hypothetical protein